jgi:hypothetical protein
MADYTIEVSVPNVGPQGETGATGPANSLAIGAVTTGAAGTTASATITGTAPTQTLSLTIPRGDTGANALTAQDLTPLKALIWRNPDTDVVRERINNDNTKTFTNFGNLPDAFLPTLTDLEFYRDFAGEKTLDHAAGPSITFTRASGATFFDANSVIQTAANGVPRFDHDPANSNVSRGLLLEESRTNIFQRSEELNNAYWTKSQVTITANAATAPDGTTTADEMVEDSSNDGHGINRTGAFAFTSGTSYTVSVFVKASSGTRNIRLAFGTGGFAANSRAALFNPHNGTVVSSDAGTTATIQAAGSSYYRVVLTATANATVATGTVFIAMVDGTTFSYTGNNTSSLYIWGAQLEAGAFATSYIPTTSAAATRAADSAIVTPVSSFYNAAEGTLFTAFRPRTVTGTRTLSAFDNDTEDEQVRLRNVDTDPRLTVNDGGVEQANIDAGTVAAATDYRLAGAFKLDDFAASLNGASVATDTTGTMPTITHLRIGNSKAGNIYNGAISRIAYWPRRLTNTLLQQLTT